MKNKDKNSYYCGPGDKISTQITEDLGKINETYSKDKDFPKYMQAIATLFKLEPPKITNERKLFFGGFIEGEGSLNVSAKRLKTSKFGLVLDPEFSLTQHVNGVNHLFVALCIFQTGRIRLKGGSNATLSFSIENRISIESKVIPFYESYINPYSSETKLQRLRLFKKIILLFKEKSHQNLEVFVNEMLPLWDDLRMQKTQKNESFSCLEEAQDFILDHIKNKK